MAADEVVTQARYEEWLRLGHLSMEPALAAAEHPFRFENLQVTIRLPSLPPDNKPPDRYAPAYISIRRSATNEPIQVEVYAVLVIISGLTFSLPSAAAASSHENASLYTAEQSRELDTRSNQLWFLTRRAIDYWLRVVRYHTDFALISLDIYPGDATLTGGRLINSTTNARFYSPSIQRIVVAPASHRLTSKEWEEIGADLKQGESPPIWREYLVSGCQRIENGDLKAAIIDLATCSELAIRRSIENRLPALITSPGVRDIVARTNMEGIFRRWEDLNLPPKTSIPNFSTVTTLFGVRNSIAHRGEDDRVTEGFCKQAATAVKDLLCGINA